MLSVATPTRVVAGPITRVPNPITTITTHTSTGEERRILLSPPGHFVDQAGVCQGVEVAGSLMQCNTTIGEDIPTPQRFDQTSILLVRVMAETYAADRDRTEREKERASGATGIPFSHATSVQGNPMRAGGWSSSSRYHQGCTREEPGWSDRVPSY